ncbi:hypothetical protein Pfo_015427 [Paulownia fortunei]|nr:hypothetical protein Pfo_015427 [Paulownia fortunei]
MRGLLGVVSAVATLIDEAMDVGEVRYKPMSSVCNYYPVHKHQLRELLGKFSFHLFFPETKNLIVKINAEDLNDQLVALELCPSFQWTFSRSCQTDESLEMHILDILGDKIRRFETDWRLDVVSNATLLVVSEAHATTLSIEDLLGVVAAVASLTDEGVDDGEASLLSTNTRYDFVKGHRLS